MKYARISHLFAACCPSDIARFVVAVVVNAIERQLRRWATSDVIKEESKTISPSVAYLNASSAVVSIFSVLGVIATLFHGPPQDVFNGRAQAMCPLVGLTSTGRGCPDSQVSDKHFALFAAYAAAKQIPHTDHPSVSVWAKYSRRFFKYGPMANNRTGLNCADQTTNVKGHTAQL